MFDGSKNDGVSCLRIFKHFIDLKHWVQGWDGQADTAEGWLVKDLQYQAVGNGLT